MTAENTSPGWKAALWKRGSMVTNSNSGCWAQPQHKDNTHEQSHRRHIGKGRRRQNHVDRVARRGARPYPETPVCVVDFDVGLRNLDLVIGAERRVVYDFINVAQGDAKFAQALIRDKRVDTLYLLAASQTRDKDALTIEGVERVIGELRETFDYVLCDSPAGIERGALLAMRHADEAIVVANPEVSSVRELRPHHRPPRLQDAAGRAWRADGQALAPTRFNPARSNSGEMLSIEDVLEILSIPLLGVIPETERSCALPISALR